MADLIMNRPAQPRRSFLQTVALASVALSVGNTGVQAGDSVLVELKRYLDAAHADVESVIARTDWGSGFEADQALDDACDRREAIVAQIERVPATTIEGIKVKLGALDGIYRECQAGPQVEDIADQPTTDMRLIIQILNALRAL